jgi:HSP20 family protein
MTLIKWNTQDSNSETVDRRIFPSLFSDFFDGFIGNELLKNEPVNFVPAVNISETPEAYKIDIAAPGISKKDIRIEIDNGILSISGERKEERKEENKRFTRREFSYGSFKRSFTLPDAVDPEKIKADFENGVLLLSLPKREEAKQKPIKEIKIS